MNDMGASLCTPEERKCPRCHPPPPPPDHSDEVVRGLLVRRGHTCLSPDVRSHEWCRGEKCAGKARPTRFQTHPSWPPGTEMFVYTPDPGALCLVRWLKDAGHRCADENHNKAWEVSFCGGRECRRR